MSVSITGNGIPLFRLLAMRSAVKLEALGIRHSRGSITAMAKRELGVKGNRDRVLAALDAAIKVAESNLRPGDITSTDEVR